MGREHVPFLALLFVGLTGIAAQQSSKPSPPAPQPPLPLEVLHTGTQLVVVDVVVQDRNGHPVHGLTRDNFLITEQKKTQTIHNFDEHTAASPATTPQLPPLPPGTFTDYTPVGSDNTLNVLLIDTLNTPMKDQMFVRQQLLSYIKHQKPGTRMAIFGLSSRLYMLQGFTSDPAILKAAIDRHLIARSSPLLNDPTGIDASLSDSSDLQSPDTSGDDGSIMSAAASMQQFEAQEQAFQTQLRIQYTIDAFDDMGHYLANFPGRKNLVWFSGAFPINIMPDPSLNDPFAIMETNDDEFHEMTNLLTHAQVAVYPVDARGLMGVPMLDASQSGSKYVRQSSAFGQDLSKFNQSQDEEHMTMDQMAEDTGGHAFYNTNGLADAVAKALATGANYYTLTYSPTNHDWDSGFRNIRVELMGAPAAQQLHLSYRHGYYADDPAHVRHTALATTSEMSPADSASRAVAAYSRAAVSRGAPAPADIIFEVRVLPLTAAPDPNIAPGNFPNPNGVLKPPYRQFLVDYAVVTKNLTLPLQPDGRRKGEIEFKTLVYDADGQLLNLADKDIAINVTPDTYQRMQPGVRQQIEISVPARKESFLRLIVHDIPTNRYGVVEIPSSQVSHLPPLEKPAPPAPASSSGSQPAPTPPAASTPKR